jgi:hypothetical protein
MPVVPPKTPAARVLKSYRLEKPPPPADPVYTSHVFVRLVTSIGVALYSIGFVGAPTFPPVAETVNVAAVTLLMEAVELSLLSRIDPPPVTVTETVPTPAEPLLAVRVPIRADPPPVTDTAMAAGLLEVLLVTIGALEA